jgi:flagellar hook-associated protein 1 FlgK
MAKISAGSVAPATTWRAASAAGQPGYDSSAGGQLTGFPAGATVSMTLNGTTTTIPAGGSVPFKAGASYSFSA